MNAIKAMKRYSGSNELEDEADDDDDEPEY